MNSIFLKGDHVGDHFKRTWTPKGFVTSLPMVESELKYKEYRKIQEKQRNRDYNFHLKVVAL
jgi:hypothetical protein